MLLFQDIAKIDIYEAWDPKMILFCFAITSLSIMISVLLSRFLHPSDIRGEFIQASYRSSAASLVSPLSRTFTEMQVWHH